MSDIIEIIRGRTLLIDGEWRDGDEFTDGTSLSVILQRKDIPDILVGVTRTGVRTFRIYASATTTADWPIGMYDATLNRTDAGVLKGGDDHVYGPEKFNVRVV